MTRNHILLIGLGNPILGDDGAGWKVLDALASRMPSEVEATHCAGGGLELMERMAGFEHAILIDAIQTGQAPQGAVRVLRLEDLDNPSLGHLGSAHETHLAAALDLGRGMGVSLPQNVIIVGIETGNVYEFSDTLSKSVAAAIPAAAEAVLDLIQSFLPREG